MQLHQNADCAPAQPWDEIAKTGNQKFWAQAIQAPAWYVVEAVEGKEFELAAALKAAFLACPDVEVLHLVDVIRVNRRVYLNGQVKKDRVIRKVSRFGPLIFLRTRLSKSLAESVINMPAAWAMLCAKDSDRPIVIPDEMICFYRRKATLGALLKPTDIEVGDVVRIVDGPAAGRQGVVFQIDNERALRLDTSPFGGSAPLIIEAGHVELIAKRRRPPHKPNVGSKAKR